MLRFITICIVLLYSCNLHAQSTLSFGEWSVEADGSGTAQVLWTSPATIAGFQFDCIGASVASVNGGITEKLDWMMSHNETIVLGVALTAAAYIPPQSPPTHLLTIHFDNVGDVISFDGVIFVDEQTKSIKVDASDEIVIHPDCPSDINNDSVVDVVDLLQLIGVWGDCNQCGEDIDGSGIVDVTDLLQLISFWGDCP